jgi:hypothetical protein
VCNVSPLASFFNRAAPATRNCALSKNRPVTKTNGFS